MQDTYDYLRYYDGAIRHDESGVYKDVLSSVLDIFTGVYGGDGFQDCPYVPMGEEKPDEPDEPEQEPMSNPESPRPAEDDEEPEDESEEDEPIPHPPPPPRYPATKRMKEALQPIPVATPHPPARGSKGGAPPLPLPLPRKMARQLERVRRAGDNPDAQASAKTLAVLKLQTSVNFCLEKRGIPLLGYLAGPRTLVGVTFIDAEWDAGEFCMRICPFSGATDVFSLLLAEYGGSKGDKSPLIMSSNRTTCEMAFKMSGVPNMYVASQGARNRPDRTVGYINTFCLRVNDSRNALVPTGSTLVIPMPATDSIKAFILRREMVRRMAACEYPLVMRYTSASEFCTGSGSAPMCLTRYEPEDGVFTIQFTQYAQMGVRLCASPAHTAESVVIEEAGDTPGLYDFQSDVALFDASVSPAVVGDMGRYPAPPSVANGGAGVFHLRFWARMYTVDDPTAPFSVLIQIETPTAAMLNARWQRVKGGRAPL